MQGLFTMKSWFLFSALFFCSIATAQPVTPITAKELLPMVAQRAVQTLASDVILTQVMFLRFPYMGRTVEYHITAGNANGWFYRFYSPSRNSELVLFAYKNFSTPVIESPPTGVQIPGYPGLQPIQLVEQWLDATDALQSVKSGGAQSFIQSNPDARIISAMVFDNAESNPRYRKGKLWELYFVGGLDTLRCLLDAVTGQSVECALLTTALTLFSPQSLTIMTVHPHPASGAMTISLRIESSGHAELRLIDLLGRQTQLLLSDPLPAGEHSLALSPENIPPGLYVLRLSSHDRSVFRNIVIR